MLGSWPLRLSLFWTWWNGELKSLFARKTAIRPPGLKSYCELHLADTQLEVTEVTFGKVGDERKLLEVFAPATGNAPPPSLARRSRPLILTMPVEKCFLHSVEVPKAALSRIDPLLKLELSRVTPFSAGDVLTGWYETDAVSSDTHVTVTQIIARRSVLTPVLDDLAKWKIPVAGIYARIAEGEYLPASLRNTEVAIGDPGLGRWRKLAFAAAGFACLCVVIAAWGLFSRQAAELADLSQRIEIAQKKAVTVRKRLDQMASSSQRIVDLKTAKLQGPSPLAIWEELTRLIPDTAWISALSIEKAQVTIEGNARSPEELIPLLDGSALFEAVSFAAPVTKLPGNDLTRFVIRLSLSRDVKMSSAVP